MTFENLSFDYTGKNVLVVGGSRGIGKGVTEAFMAAGARVFYASRNPAENLRKAIFIRTDLSKPEEIDNLFHEINKAGGTEIIVNTAGVNYCKSIEEITLEEWNEVMDINLRAAFLICKWGIEVMGRKSYGKIVNVSSIAGRHRSVVSGVHYVSSKAGLIGLTRQVAYLAAPYNINVNVVCPSQTMTGMLAESMNDDEISALAANIPLKRVANVAEQVGPILFLCSDAASYITGAVIDINGGQM